MSKDFITIQEAAEYLGKSAQTIRRMIKRGDLNAKRIKTPQGFHYVLPREEIEYKPARPKVVEKTPEEMLDNTIVEKSVEAQVIEEIIQATSQNELLTNQQPVEPQKQAPKPTVDKSDVIELLNRHHKENILMLRIIDKLQRELDSERRRPKSLLAYFFDWLSH